MKIAIACAAALAAVTVAGAQVASADPEADFLSLIGKGGITWPPEKTPQVIGTGYAVCRDWDSGASFDQEVGDLTGVTGWSNPQARYFIGAATTEFCPEYQDKVS